jgi:hypothetical protein
MEFEFSKFKKNQNQKFLFSKPELEVIKEVKVEV